MSPGAKVQPNLSTSRRIQCGLEFDVEGACSGAAAVHRAENLDIADGIEAKTARDTGFDQLDDARNRDLGIVRLDKIEDCLIGGTSTAVVHSMRNTPAALEGRGRAHRGRESARTKARALSSAG